MIKNKRVGIVYGPTDYKIDCVLSINTYRYLLRNFVESDNTGRELCRSSFIFLSSVHYIGLSFSILGFPRYSLQRVDIFFVVYFEWEMVLVFLDDKPRVDMF